MIRLYCCMYFRCSSHWSERSRHYKVELYKIMRNLRISDLIMQLMRAWFGFSPVRMNIRVKTRSRFERRDGVVWPVMFFEGLISGLMFGLEAQFGSRSVEDIVGDRI